MVALSKAETLSNAIEVTKEYARGGGSTDLSIILERVYETIKKLNQDTDEE